MAMHEVSDLQTWEREEVSKCLGTDSAAVVGGRQSMVRMLRLTAV